MIAKILIIAHIIVSLIGALFLSKFQLPFAAPGFLVPVNEFVREFGWYISLIVCIILLFV